MRILLTGATGFLGNNLLRILLESGHDVQVILRAGITGNALTGLNYDPIHGDLSRPDTLLREAGDFDVLIHSAAVIQLGWSKLAESRLVNVEATSRLAEFCRIQGRRMIHVSTVDTLAHSIDGSLKSESDREPRKPQCSYVVSKTEAEVRVQEQIALGLDAVIVQPGFMVGPFDWKPSSGKMLLAVAKGPPPIAPAGGFSVVDVRDVADGIVRAISRGKSGESYILGGVNMTYLDLWQRIAAIAGRRGPRRGLPDWLAAFMGRTGDLYGKFCQQEPTVNSAAVAMGQLKHFYSSAKAESVLGYRIGSVDDAIHDAYHWLVKQNFSN
jgi:dihydroflavonol-4-reductase